MAGTSVLGNTSSRGSTETPVPLPPQAMPGFRPLIDASSQANGNSADNPTKTVYRMKRTGGLSRKSISVTASGSSRPLGASTSGGLASGSAPDLQQPLTSAEVHDENLRIVSDLIPSQAPTVQNSLKRKAVGSPEFGTHETSQRPKMSSVSQMSGTVKEVQRESPSLFSSPPVTAAASRARRGNAGTRVSSAEDAMIVSISSDEDDYPEPTLLNPEGQDDEDTGSDSDDASDNNLDWVDKDLEAMVKANPAFSKKLLTTFASTHDKLSHRMSRARELASNEDFSENKKRRRSHLDSKVPDSLQTTPSGRAYDTCNDGTQLIATNGVLIPDGYRKKIVSNMPWTCPIRSCRQLFYTLSSLSKHWLKTHYRCLLNDNGDGTFTITGGYMASAPNTRISRTPAVVTSRDPRGPNDPPMVEPHYVKPTDKTFKAGEGPGTGASQPAPTPRSATTDLENTVVMADPSTDYTKNRQGGLMELKATLTMATQHRQYRQWETEDGELVSAKGALIPAGYKQSTKIPGHPWVCPFRECRRVFKQLSNLGMHFIRGHFSVLCNDNGDGTLSYVCKYILPNGEKGTALPARVVSVKPLDPKTAPRMLEEGLPNAHLSALLAANMVSPGCSPPRESSGNGRSGDQKTAEGVDVTELQPLPITAAALEMWEYIKPHLCRHKEEIPATGHVAELLGLPRVRDLSINLGWSSGYVDSLPKDISALIVQVTGEPAEKECTRCRDGKGPFKGCIILAISAPVDQQRSIVSCGNCLYHNNQTNCSLRPLLRKRVMELFPDGGDPAGYWARHHHRISGMRAKNAAQRSAKAALTASPASILPDEEPTSVPLIFDTEEDRPTTPGARRSGRNSTKEATADADRRIATLKIASGPRRGRSSLSHEVSAADEDMPDVSEPPSPPPNTAKAAAAPAPAPASTSSALLSTGQIHPTTMSAEATLEMEDWEVAPGRIRSSAPNSDGENIAFSNPYLTKNQAVSVDDGIAFRVEIIRAGQSSRFAPDEGVTRICSLASGKLRVRLEGEGNESFAIGPHGMFKLRPGVGATVENRLYVDSVLHLSCVMTG